MDHPEGEARRLRRTWLLRLFSQSLQRQQGGPAGPSVQRIQAPGRWEPGEGWAAQSSPEAALAGDDFE
ncbi:MAG TPA: hypothetical protein VFM98_10070 [Ramlibacter sp.]|uniref:hypothetical protein n=1 Tax=Ramlibacter sp. TaxID=1917967 RepID=UPI002D8103FD|nr:hypothetical protein [Ramlibacter sp.]HET8745943.1 hypothetical protein [Ramlibacter sp.]